MSIEDSSGSFIINFVIGNVAKGRKEKTILKRSRFAMFSSLIFLIILSLLLGGFVTTVAAADTGELVFDQSYISWLVGSEPTGKTFDLKVNITDVTNLKAMVFSVEWDPTYLAVLSYTPGDFLPLGMPQATGWMITWDKPAGKMKEAANSFMAGYGPTSVSKPSWGWVMTFTFEYVGPTPTADSPVDTYINITKKAGAPDYMDTKWKDSANVWHDFIYQVGAPTVAQCHFHYEAEAARAAVHLESEEDTGASTNLGTITFDGVSYSLPDNVSKAVGAYQAQYFADAGYLFDHWETTGLVSVSDANANPATVTVAGNGTLRAIYAAHHNDHFNDPTDDFPNDYAPMVIPVNDKSLTIAPIITCTILENDVFKPFHHPCKSAQTNLTDSDWSDRDANYTYVFEDWTDYDWNDIVVSLYAVTNDVIEAEIRLEDREAVWKNPFSVEITPMGMDAWVHWNSTDYPEEHIVRVNSSETVDIELFAESNPGDTAFITFIPLILPTASFVYSPSEPEEGQTVTFDASASTPGEGTIISYYWDFGDGETNTGEIVTHTYTTAGTYIVTLNVTNSMGKWDTESKQITVKPKPPPVGGHAISIKIDKFNSLTSQISLALSLLAAMAVTVILIRRKRRH